MKDLSSAGPPTADEIYSVARQAAKAGVLNAEAIAGINAAICIDDASYAASRLSDGFFKGGASKHALECIATLFEPGDVLELRALGPGSDQIPESICGRLDDERDRNALVEFIDDRNGQRNIYFGANPRTAELAGTTQAAGSDNVTERRSVFFDLDMNDAPGEDPDWRRTIESLQALDPALVVASGNGHQIWFSVDPGPENEIRDMLARIGSDSVGDLPRIARLPFTVNLPDASKRSRGAVPVLSKTVQTGTKSRKWSTTALAEKVAAVAEQLQLPGRRTRSSSSTVSGKPTPAPSPELLCAAVAALPNGSGHFNTRDEWVAIAHAVKGASISGGYEGTGRDAWLSFCGRWDGASDRVQDERVWDTLRNPHTGWKELLSRLSEVAPGAFSKIRNRAAVLDFEPVDLGRRLSRPDMFFPWQERDLTKIPYPEPLYSDVYYRGYLTVTTAPPKVGKSMLALAEAIQMVTGRDFLTPGETCERLRVLYYNLEDDQNLLNSRVSAVLSQHGINQSEIVGRLFVCSGVEHGFHLLNQDETINECAFDQLGDLLEMEDLDVLIFDPLQDLSFAGETNETFRTLARRIRSFAQTRDVAVGVIHHTRKGTPGADVSMDDMRGGGALRGAARVNRLLSLMTEKEAAGAGVEHAEKFFCVAKQESNLAPPNSDRKRWFERLSVLTPAGYSVGAVRPWVWPDFAASFTQEDIAKVRAAIQNRDFPPRQHIKADDWVGYLAAKVLNLDATKHKSRINAAIKDWLRREYLVESRQRDPVRREEVPCVEVGPVDPLADLLRRSS